MSAENRETDYNLGGQEQLKKSKRSKILLIIVIVILLAALGALVYFGYTILTEGSNKPTSGITGTQNLTDSEVTDMTAPGKVEIETTTIPNLASLFGLTTEEVTSKLGSDFQLKSSSPTTDSTNTAIKQIATFTYNPKVSGDSESASSATLPTESIYASLDEAGKVIDIYYTCDMVLLGYPEEPLERLISDESIVNEALAAAGVTPRDMNSDPEETIYDNSESVNRKITKQTKAFNGRTTSDTNPTAWILTFNYDYGITGVATANDFRQATRTISLRLA